MFSKPFVLLLWLASLNVPPIDPDMLTDLTKKHYRANAVMGRTRYVCGKHFTQMRQLLKKVEIGLTPLTQVVFDETLAGYRFVHEPESKHYLITNQRQAIIFDKTFCYYKPIYERISCVFSDFVILHAHDSLPFLNATTSRGFSSFFFTNLRTQDKILRNRIAFDYNSTHFGVGYFATSVSEHKSPYLFDIRSEILMPYENKNFRTPDLIFKDADFSMDIELKEDYPYRFTYSTYLGFKFRKQNDSGIFIFSEKDSVGQFFPTNFRTTKLFLYSEWTLPHYIPHSNFLNNNSLIFFSDDKINIVYLTFKTPRNISKLSENEIEMNHGLTISTLDFFNCYSKLRNPDFLNGILVLEKTYYLFINRFYLSISENLLLSKFKIQNKYYQTAREILEEENTSLDKKINYEMMGAKWILRLHREERFTLRLFNDVYRIHKLNRNTTELNFTHLNIHDLVDHPRYRCDWQSLVLTNFVYCLTPKFFFPLIKNENSDETATDTSETVWYSAVQDYASMFDNTNYDFEEDLIFVLDLRTRFVLITFTKFYVIPYTIVEEVWSSFGKYGRYDILIQSQEGLEVHENHLFDSPKKPVKHFLKTRFERGMIMSFMSIVILIMVAALLYKQTKKKQTIPQITTDSATKHHRINLTRQDLERKERYRQLFGGFNFISRSFSFFKASKSKTNLSLFQPASRMSRADSIKSSVQTSKTDVSKNAILIKKIEAFGNKSNEPPRITQQIEKSSDTDPLKAITQIDSGYKKP